MKAFFDVEGGYALSDVDEDGSGQRILHVSCTCKTIPQLYPDLCAYLLIIFAFRVGGIWSFVAFKHSATSDATGHRSEQWAQRRI